MLSDWTYNGDKITSISDIEKIRKKPYGFVYLLKLYDAKTGVLKFQYIGKKNLYMRRTKLATNKELSELPKSEFTRKRKKGKTLYYRTIVKESDWLNYYSSNDFIRKNSKKFKIDREILMVCDNDSDLSYREAQQIICNDAMDDATFLNNGVSIRRFATKVF